MLIYGPVPSRRLGFSFGVDVIPFKTCSFDCIYCQLGRTTSKTVERKEWIPQTEILSELEKTLSMKHKIDYITFSGSGEPTLNSKIGELIKSIKRMTSIPIAVLTNGSLLFQKDLREGLLDADLIVPSLDTTNQEIFEKVNRPYPSLNIDMMINGLKDLRKEFKGLIWLEVMFVEGINDGFDEIKKLKSIIGEVKPDKVQLNTVVRPPTESFARPISVERSEKIKDVLGGKTEIIAKFKREKQMAYLKDIEERILTLIERRPVTAVDISNSLGMHRTGVIKYLDSLNRKGKIKIKSYRDDTYYESNYSAHKTHEKTQKGDK